MLATELAHAADPPHPRPHATRDRASAPASVPRAPLYFSEPSGPSAPPVALFLGGLGIAGVAVGATAGLLTLEEKGIAEDHCSSTLRVCDTVGVQANENGLTLSRVSLVGFLVGALGIGGAIVLWHSPDRREGRVSIEPAVSQAGPEAVLVGTW
jgi:hypothetical protein